MTLRFKTLIFSFLYPFFWIYYKLQHKDYPNVYSSEESLNIIKKTKKSLCRYGDGELNLIFGRSIGFQKNDYELAHQLKDIIMHPSPNCFVAIPNIFENLRRFSFEAKCFWVYTLVKNWGRWKTLIDKKYHYLDTQCSRFYIDLKNKNEAANIIKEWKNLWEGEDIIIIEGKYTKMGVGNNLFNNSKSVRRIICPPKNAYKFLYRIKDEVLKLNKNNLILIALGPTATVLAHELSKKGYWAIDSGHLDLEYNWMNSKSKKKEKIEGRLINEINKNQKINEENDERYLSQIIVDLSNLTN